MNCPSCGRPVAMARASCLYCGGALSAETVARAEKSRAATFAPEARREDRALVVVRLEGATAGALAAALGLSAYEAGQWSRGGGWRLIRAAAPAEAEADRERLAAQGLTAFVLDEAATREAAEPLAAQAATFDGGALEVRTTRGAERLAPADLLLVVKGPIAREFAARADRVKFPVTATLDPGMRLHLHTRSGARAIEIDPAEVELGAHRAGQSTLLEIAGWMDALSAHVPVDEGFRRLPPALAPARPPRGFGRAEETPLQAAAREGAVLDNVAQFRFYSAWRGAAERLVRR
jgi:hypothetical protein